MFQRLGVALIALAALAAPATAQAPTTREFSVRSADGAAVTGQADLPAHAARVAVVMVAGTGPFDRDVNFGHSGTPRDLIFADLAQRFTQRGLAVVRYDKRGIRHGVPPEQLIDHAAGATQTTDTLRDDLAAVYRWTQARDGLNARCVILFGHSEGTAHIGRLADSGAPAPLAIIGVGVMEESPATGFRWRVVERDAYSLRLMDADHDGRTTDEEVRANYAHTPSAVAGHIEYYLHNDPNVAWTPPVIAALEQAQAQGYDRYRTAMLARADNAPYPDAATAYTTYQWWKSWLLDTTPVALRMAHWNVPMIFHYGSRDSQTNYERERAAGEPILGSRVRYILHPDRGHTLGEDPTYGPMDEAIANQIADEAAAEARRCR